AGRPGGGALRAERNSQDRLGGADRPDGAAEDDRAYRRVGPVRGARTQVSDLGAGALLHLSRGGQREGEGVASAAWPQKRGRTSRSKGMTAGRGAPSGAAGGPVRHRPVLLREALSSLSPKDGGGDLDGTFG